MLKYLILLLTFFKIGLFGFGGGYAMIPLMQKELLNLGGINAGEFADIIAVSQITPGAFAVNVATYTGARILNLPGMLFAVSGVVLPSFLIMALASKFFLKFKNSNFLQSILEGIRPVTIGLIASAVVFLAQMSIFKANFNLKILNQNISAQILPLLKSIHVNVTALIIFVLILYFSKKYKLHPIISIVLSAFLGIILL